MKLSWALIASSCQGKKIYGCDPSELEHYEMVEEGCKRFKGMNTVPGNVEGHMGIMTEKKSNYCRRQCKYGDLPQTVQTMCKCKKISGKFECWYQIKLQKTIKGWVPFNHTDTDGNYPLDKYGEGGFQPACVLPSDKGDWGQWGAWSECDGECGLGKRTRTRACSSQWCGDDGTEEMECVKYADTNKYSPHDCNKGDNWLFKDTNADDDLECTLRGGGNCEYYNDGHYCVMPSHGGWPLANEQFGDESVTMGIECEGDEVYPFDSYVITGLNAKCKVVCKGDKGGLYMPETLFWHKFRCLTPIPIQLTKETNCYSDKWNGHANLEGECLLDWQEKGLGLKTVSQGYSTWPEKPVPWYFNTQIWPHSGCAYGCGTHRNLQQTHEVVNKCYKVEGTEYPTCGGKPPRTQAEKDAGTPGSEIKWDCDDGWNAGSICQKSCSNPSHIMTSGNPRMICHCSENDEGVFGCDWKITQENPNPGYSTHLSYTDSADCIGACNGNSKSWGSNSDPEYTVNCDGIGEVPGWSSSVFPVMAGGKCRVHCGYDDDKDYWYIGLYPREWMLTNFYETGTNTFELTCQKTASGDFEFVGDFTKCEHVCTPMGVLKGDENHPDLDSYGTPTSFECTDGWRIGSTCTKQCPEGQKLSGGGKSSKTCKKGGYANWSSNYAKFKDCEPV